MRSPGIALESLETTIILIAAVGAIALLTYQLREFVPVLFGAARGARTIDDWIIVLLVAILAVVIIGDYLAYVVIASLSYRLPISAAAAFWVHFVPHLFAVGILFVRVVLLLVAVKNVTRALGRTWRRTCSVFLVAAGIDGLDYVLRQAVPDFYWWIVPTWPGFWWHCAVLGVAMWLLASVSHAMAPGCRADSLPGRTEVRVGRREPGAVDLRGDGRGEV